MNYGYITGKCLYIDGRPFGLPKQYNQKAPQLWHGFTLRAGMLFGKDDKGYYVTTTEFENRMMRFYRLVNGQWCEVITPWYESKVVQYIVQHYPCKPFYRKNTKYDGLRQMACGKDAIRKFHCKASGSSHPRNDYAYVEASREVYGDTIEMNGKDYKVSEGLACYMDGVFK